MKIIGISSYYHDSAACLVIDGVIIAAAQEERFTRVKHDSSFPVNAIKYCLIESNLNLENIDFFVFYDKPFVKFERLFETYLAFAPRGLTSFITSMPLWLTDKLFQKNKIKNDFQNGLDYEINLDQKLLFSEHHLSHAASAFYPSPFKDAAILTMDGVGEWATTSISIGNKNKISILKEIDFPHSIGLLYSAFTYYTGFKVNSGEYKLMGLAPYGNPIYSKLIKYNLINIKEDGSFNLDMSYFSYCTGLEMTSNKFSSLFDGKRREPESNITQKEMDIAASIQQVTEEILLKIINNISQETKLKHLTMAGGVALNCVANGKILRSKIFEKVWIQPASGDSGGAIGAALAVNYLMLDNKRIISQTDSMNGSYLGPSFCQEEIELRLNKLNANFITLSEDELIKLTVEEIILGKAIGWHQGRMEFGPRALGNRSIIADPRSSIIQKQLNLKIKYRESFRPFAPSILNDHINEWFDLDVESPYMLIVADVKKEKQLAINSLDYNLFGIEKLNITRSIIPAVTHVDFSSRIQSVDKYTNHIYYKLISKFYELTGCPILVNTSFNIRGEPIVNSPEDAYRCFMGTELDILIIGNSILYKNNQFIHSGVDYKNKYDLD